MNRALRMSGLLGPVLVCALFAGCSALTRPYPEKEYFAIDVGEPEVVRQSANEWVLRVKRLRLSSPYDGQDFVYRVGRTKFATDYYNGFVASPDQLLTGELMEWFSGAGLFSSVVDSGSSVDHRFVLEGNVTALYGDYTDEQAPKAVVEAKFFLLDDGGAETKLVFQKAYLKDAPLRNGEPASLAAALGDAYREVLGSLTVDLAGVDLKKP